MPITAAQRATLEMDCLTGKTVEREKPLAHLKKAFRDGRGQRRASAGPGEVGNSYI
jgi:hypothetical protein